MILTLSPFESFIELASLELELEVEVALKELGLALVIFALLGIMIFIVLLLLPVVPLLAELVLGELLYVELPLGVVLLPCDGEAAGATSTIAMQSADGFPPHVASTFATTPSIVAAEPCCAGGVGD